MPERRKKMIEVALPLEAINRESAREKAVPRHGHPQTLHLWWARRPLAACRAVLFASMVDDPNSDPMYRGHEESAAAKRADLFNLIEELVHWENSNNPDVLNRARAEIARCIATGKVESGEWTVETEVVSGATAGQIRSRKAPPEAVNAFLAQHAPPVYDPFCGGGSIPLEAQRLGLRAYASDLNPVPVLITKALIEIPPKFAGMTPVNPESRRQQTRHADWSGAKGLAEDIRYYGRWMRDEAVKRIGHLYPRITVTTEMARDRPDLTPYVDQELTTVAWLWARTVECPNPACRVRTPLVSSFSLAKKKGGKEVYLQPVLDGVSKTVRFEVRLDGSPIKGTSDRTGARCLFCPTFIKKQQLREIASAKGVAEIPLAIVCDGPKGRIYLASQDISSLSIGRPDVGFLDQAMTNDKRWFSPPLYGLPNFADIFTPRQLVALTTFSSLVSEARRKLVNDMRKLNTSAIHEHEESIPQEIEEYANGVATYLSFALSKLADYSSSLCGFIPGYEKFRSTFGRQALPMAWDFAELNTILRFARVGGGFRECGMWEAGSLAG